MSTREKKIRQSTMINESGPGKKMYLASLAGNATIVKEILAKSHAPITYVNSNGNSALHIAFIHKREEVVDLILTAIQSSSTFDPLSNPMGLTHLHIACTRKNEKIVQGFLDAGAKVEDTVDIQSKLWAGFNALHFAATFQSLEVVKVLLKAGMNRNSKTSAGKTALELIHENFGDILIMVDLLEDGLQKRNFSNFQIACLNEDKKLVQKFIDHGAAEINFRITNELSTASLRSPLHYAVASDCEEMIELLLRNGAEVECVNNENMTPLHLALYKQSSVNDVEDDCIFKIYNNRIAKMLYEAVDNKMASHEDLNGLSFFHAAIASNDIETVKRYINEGKADVNKSLSSTAGHFSNYTPLHMAVLFESPEIAEFLISHGADVNASGQQRITPLHLALSNGYHNLIELLLLNEAKVDIATVNQQKTMLHFIIQFINCSNYLSHNEKSSEKANIESFLMYVEQLVKLGVEINAKDTNGDTALHYLYSPSDHWAPCFAMLLALGADVNLMNHSGSLPFDSNEWRIKNLKNKVNVIFYHHVQALKALGLKVDPGNDEICRLIAEDGKCFENEELIGRKQQITEEIEKLKSIKIGDATSLYNFIKLDAKRATLYKECKLLKNFAEDVNLKKEFPSYGYLVLLKYRAAVGFCSSPAKKRLHCDADGETPFKRQYSE